MKFDRDLTLEQENLIKALLLGKNIQEAAKEVGISESTARRWSALPHVEAAYQLAKSDISSHIHEQIKQLATKAIQALSESLDSETASVRLKAAQVVIDRVAPIASIPVQQSTDTTSRPDYSSYTREELNLLAAAHSEIERIKAEAEARKDEKITPIRRMG